MRFRIRKRTRRIILIILGIGFLLYNIIAFNHAYRFTHFASAGTETGKEEQLSFGQKIGVLFTGVTKVKSQVERVPANAYLSFSIGTNDTLRGWIVQVPNAKGIAIMGHGYGANKGTLVDEAAALNKLGYTAVLFDFHGHGESSGYTTTVGYKEAEDAAKVFEFVKTNHPGTKIYLYGVSMGAVAMLRAAGDLHIPADGLILECPYGSMLSAAQNRFRIMGVPSFPSAQLLVFWGGVHNGFWAFNNNSYDFAEGIKIPTLIVYGKHDERAKEKENLKIYDHLKGRKQIVSFNAGHESYYCSDTTLWKSTMASFLDGISSGALK
jgi:uncharacterized protein